MTSKHLAYYCWANRQWIDFIYDNYPQDEYMLKLINHIAKGARAWTDRIGGADWNRDLWGIENKDELIALEDNIRHRIESLTEQRLTDRMHITRLNGLSHNPAIADIVQHLLIHGDHHRGQLASYAVAKGYKKPDIDYLNFCIIHQL